MDRSEFSVDDVGLPPELRVELGNPAPLRAKTVELFKIAGGTLNVSEILVGFYKMYGEIHKRNKIVGLLYRLQVKGLLRSTGRKGEYILID